MIQELDMGQDSRGYKLLGEDKSVFRKCSLQHEIVVGQDSRGYKLL
jgi:hypothetical protein